jgi:hypothetical protein
VTVAPVGNVKDVIARMETILHPLGRSDGVACFLRLYVAVTEGVQEQLAGLSFADPRFLAELDTCFAGLFFAALDAHAVDSRTTPRAWAPLFEARSKAGIAPLQFALAGMNAHINRDLPIALVDCFRRTGVVPEEGSAQHRDYLRINGLLGAVEQRVKQQYLTGWLTTVDRILHRVHRLDDVVAMWDITRARDAAWTNAEALWALRTSPELSSRYLDTLDRSVGLAGRGLLTPADTWLGRLRRAVHLW